MNTDDIIRMAREADFGFMTEKPKSHTHMQCTVTGLERFAALVAAAEREECAKAAESVFEQNNHDDVYWGIPHAVAAIRARGQA